MAKLIKKFLLLNNEDLSVIGYGLYIAAMIGFVQMFIGFLQYGQSFLQGQGSAAEWMMILSAVGIVVAFGAIIITLFWMYTTWHERRSFKPISY